MLDQCFVPDTQHGRKKDVLNNLLCSGIFSTIESAMPLDARKDLLTEDMVVKVQCKLDESCYDLKDEHSNVSVHKQPSD